MQNVRTNPTDRKKLTELQPIKVTVLAGGPSRERDVSLVSGAAVADALRTAGFQVTVADISPNDLSALDIPADVVFPVLHGRFGEDGQLQAILEKRNIVYCGSESEACQLTMNKYRAKLRMIELNIPTPKFDCVLGPDDLSRAKTCWQMPVVVKPVCEGSSLGITIVHHAHELGSVIAQTFEQYGPTLIEQFIDGRELTVGIFNDKALPILEIKPKQSFYDYHAKYLDPETDYTFVQDLPKQLIDDLKTLSVRAAVGLGLRDFTRIDWRLDRNHRPFFLEANAIPGFTDHSLLPKAAAFAGDEMGDFCRKIVELALNRAQVTVKT